MTMSPALALCLLLAGADDVGGDGPIRWTLSAGLLTQLDAYSFAGPGVSDYQRADGTMLSSAFSVHAVRALFHGTVADRLYYNVALDFGPSNTAGPGQSFTFRGGAAIAAVDYPFSEAIALRVGQFPLPVTWENIRPGATFDFMESSRTMAIVCPVDCVDLGLMVFGHPGPFTYGIGIFNGEGRNRTAVGQQGDVDGRVSLAINRDGENRLKLGLSGRIGVVDPRGSWADAPVAGFTTEHGYQFWTPVYQANTTPSPTNIHVVPSNLQRAAGADLVLELGRFDIQAEGAYVDFGRRETTQTMPDVEETIRSGALTGFMYYVTANLWLLAPSPALKALRWNESQLQWTRTRTAEPVRSSMQLLVRWEQLFLDYDSIARSNAPIERGLLDEYTTRLRADVLQLSFVYWLSTHFKLAVEWSIYLFPGEVLEDGRHVDNQALAPGAVIPGERGTHLPPEIPPEVTPASNPSYFMPAAPGASSLHEISARVQLRF